MCDEFSAQKILTVRAGFEPGTARTRVLSLTTRPSSLCTISSTGHMTEAFTDCESK